LYFLWNDGAGAGFRIPGSGVSDNVEIISVKSVLSPESIVVNLGAENYTSRAETVSLWYGAEDGDAPSFMSALMKFLAFDNIAVGAISKEDFEDVMRARSIRADFSFAVPTADFCEEFRLGRPSTLDAVDAFTCVAYSEASPESLFLCNKLDDRFFRLAVDGDAGFKELIAFVETFDNESYYPLRTFSGVENDTLLPLDAPDAPTELAYARSLDPYNDADAARIIEMTRAFFGSSFDFTRKIIEGNGTTVYMYGYGEKVFVINRDGSFEYSATAADSERGGAISVFDALETALAFISSHNERGDERGLAAKQIYLKDVRYSFAEGRRVYGFWFGIKINGYKVYYTDSEPLFVEVTEQHVNYYKLDMIDGVLDGAGSPGESAFAPFDILTEHFAYIYDVLSAKELVAPFEDADDEAVFEKTISMVSGLSYGLLRPDDSPLALTRRAVHAVSADDTLDQNLLPVWVLTVGNIDFCFDIYTGEPEGYME
jgi:hypothetical protein